MEHEDPLDALIELERARLAPEWEDVAFGRASADEAEQRIRARGASDDEEISRARELFAPLSPEFEDALIERLVPTVPVPKSEPVVDRRDPAWWRRPAVIAVTAAAAAAALALVWARPGDGPSRDDDRVVTSGPSIPSHELILSGVADVRGTGDAEVTVPAGGSLRVTLRPATRYGFTPTVWACLSQGGQDRPIAIATERGEPGTAILATVQIPNDLAVGSWELATVLASRPVPAAEQRCDLGDASDLQVRRRPFRVVPPR